MIDFSTIKVVSAAKAGAPMPVLHPHTGADTGAVLHVQGYDCPDVVNAVREYNRAHADNMGNDADLAAMVVARKVELACAAVIGWNGFGWDGMADVPFERSLLEQVLRDPEYYWLVMAIDTFGSNRGNYGGGTVTS